MVETRVGFSGFFLVWCSCWSPRYLHMESWWKTSGTAPLIIVFGWAFGQLPHSFLTKSLIFDYMMVEVACKNAKSWEPYIGTSIFSLTYFRDSITKNKQLRTRLKYYIWIIDHVNSAQNIVMWECTLQYSFYYYYYYYGITGKSCSTICGRFWLLLYVNTELNLEQ